MPPGPAVPRRFAFDPPGALPLVAEVLAAAGWQETTLEAGDWELLWTLGEPGPGVVAQLRPGQRVNHLPGIGALARKDMLAATLERGLRLLAARGAAVEPFHPETFVMPERLPALRLRDATAPGTVWIQKPRAAARGEGIRLLADVDEAETGTTWLVQRYLDRPHLIDGRKYTLRRYVLVDGLDPLRVLVFDDGFTKLAGRPFSLRGTARADRFAHLTNPDILAADPDLPVSRDNLTQGAYAELLRAEGHDPAALFSRIDDLIAATVGASRDELSRCAWSATNQPAGCFELLGFDIAVDEELRPWLVECNMDPSLSVEADPQERAAREESALKRRLIEETLRATGLLGTDSNDQRGPRLLPLLPDPAGRGRLLPLPRPGETTDPVHAIPATGVTALPLEDGLALHEPVAGAAHLFDALSAYLYAAHGEGLTADEIAAEVAETWPDAAWRAAPDVRNALAEWHELGLSRAADAAPPTVPAPRAARPRLRWNRERAYRLLDTVLCVTVPDDECDGWLQAVLGGLADDDAAEEHLRAEILPLRGGWEIAIAGGLVPVRSARQLGSVLRRELLREALGASTVPAFSGTLLGDPEVGRVLVLGPRPLRAAFAAAWLRDGGSCLGDDVVTCTTAGLVAGARAGFERFEGTEWAGPLPGLGDPKPVHLSLDGTFARVTWPELTPAEPAPVPLILCVEGATLAETPFAPMPRRPTQAVQALIGGLATGTRVSADHLAAAVALGEGAKTFWATLADPSIGRSALSILKPLC